MDDRLRNMDFRVKHWAPLQRRFPSAFPLGSVDFVPRKNCWLHCRFVTCNFSLILRGRGEFRRHGKTWPVQAPCVITQWPGDLVEYGPPIPVETWDELYFIYDARLMDRFKECHLIAPDRPVWPIANVAMVLAQIAELQSLANSATPEFVVDQVDRICERIILSTWLPPCAPEDGFANSLQADVRQHMGVDLDLEKLAARHGMSLSTFRRRWAEGCAISPARYLQELRIREACRLLAETTSPISEIAHSVGFPDELYFSRRFHNEMHMPPREYRKIYLIPRRETL